MTLRGLLRIAGLAIAVLAIVDPALPLGPPPEPPIVIIGLAQGGTAAVTEELTRLRAGDEVIERSLAAHNIPCSVDERCVLVADGSVAARLPSDLRNPAALVVLEAPPSPNVRIESLMLSPGQHAAAAGVVSVVLSANGTSGRRSEIRVTDGDAVIGTAVHEWKADGRASIDVPWWPIASGARSLRVSVEPAAGEAATFDNTVDAAVEVTTARLPVLVFDARPSWQSTYVRRALEDDPRFRVEHRARLAPSISAGTASGRLDAPGLAAAHVMIAGGLEGLTASEVDQIERFAREGGGVILLPDQRPTGAASRLFAGQWRERLSAQASDLGPLRAAEVLTASSVLPTSTVLAPSTIATPLGKGVIVIAGAMDAWRYRDANAGAYDRFWRSLTVEAGARRVPIRITFGDAVARANARLGFTVDTEATKVAAVVRCGGGAAQPVRLWPAASDEYRGEASIAERGPCALEVAAGEQRAMASIAVVARPSRPAADVLAALERDVRRRGGVVSTPGDLAPIATGLEPDASSSGARTTAYPMRSPWWIVPFAALLSLEWWHRRRSGLR